jgi:hypothetical protein
MTLHGVLPVVLAAACVHPAAARVLQVGAGQAYAVPSAAAAVAQDGDTVAIAPGTYFDCAVWRADHLTIAGTGPSTGPDPGTGPGPGRDVVVTDRACAGKAAFVITGNTVVVRGIVFTRIRVADGNGAGIRAEGRDLTVEDSRFVNNQIGILAGGPGGSLFIDGCSFSANGVSLDGRPTHGVLAGELDLLRIEHSSFTDARGGDHIASAARRTELLDNHLADQGGGMTGALVTVSGGMLNLDGNTIELTAAATDRPGAVLVTGDAGGISVQGNILIEAGGDVPMLRNWTSLPASESANTVPADVQAVSDRGAVYHRLRARLALLSRQAHAALAVVRQQVAAAARRLHLIP